MHRWLCELLLLLAISITHRRLPILWLSSKSTACTSTILPPTKMHLWRWLNWWLSCLIQIVIARYTGCSVDSLEASIGGHIALILCLTGHYLGLGLLLGWLLLLLCRWSALGSATGTASTGGIWIHNIRMVALCCLMPLSLYSLTFRVILSLFRRNLLLVLLSPTLLTLALLHLPHGAGLALHRLGLALQLLHLLR